VTLDAQQVAAEEPESAPLNGALNFAWLVWQRKWMLAVGGTLGLVLGLLYYARQPPVYQSSAQVLVVKKQPDLPIQGVDSRQLYYDDYLVTHQMLIRSPVIIKRSVQKFQLESLKSFEGQGDPTDRIIATLSTSRPMKDAERASILNLSFRGGNSEDCNTILNAVIDSYKDFLDETYRSVNNSAQEMIKQAQKILEVDLKKKQDAYLEFRRQNPLLWRGKEGAEPLLTLASELEKRRSILIVRRAEVEARLAALENAKKAGRRPVELIAIVYEMAGRSAAEGPQKGGASLQAELLQLQLQLKNLLERYDEGHPDIKSVRSRIELTRKLIASPSAVLRSDTAPKDQDQEEARLMETVDLYGRSLRYDLDDIQGSEQVLTRLLDKEQGLARQLSDFEVTAEKHRTDIALTQKLYEAVLNRLQEVRITQDVGGFDAQVITPPSPGVRVEPKAPPIVLGGILLGLLAGVGLAYLTDRLDTSFRTPEEIRRRLNLPVVGHVPCLARVLEVAKTDGKGGGLDPILCAYHQPMSVEAEAVRGVRTVLFFSAQGKGHRVIQVTSPEKGDGKSTLSANLAVSIAQAGKSILLIDADLRKPRQHRLFGLSPSLGLAAVIGGDAEPQDAIQSTAVPGLSILPCGPLPANPAELLTAPRFQELLAIFREKYDFVLIDTPALLAVSDGSVVAPRVDGVLLVIRISKNGRQLAERAKEVLTGLGVNILGVVVTALDRQSGPGMYSYAYYHYGYGDEYDTDAKEQPPEVEVAGSPTSKMRRWLSRWW